MPLESATYVDDLVSTNPLGTDDASLGDDHIRLIKSVLKNTFPNLDGALTTKLAALNGVSQLITVGEDGTTLTFNFPSGGTVGNVTDWTSNQPVPASQADGRYVASTVGGGDTGNIQQLTYNTDKNQLSAQTRDGTWHFAQPAGDYATNSALNTETTNLQNQINNRVLKTGDSMTGPLYTTSWISAGANGGFNGPRSKTGDLAWTNGIEVGNPTNNGNYRATMQVTDVLNEGGSNQAGINFTGYDAGNIIHQYYFAWNGNIQTPKGLVAFESDLPTAGTITGGTYTKTPMNDGTGRSVLVQSFTVQAANMSTITLPIAMDNASYQVSLTTAKDTNNGSSSHTIGFLNNSKTTTSFIFLKSWVTGDGAGNEPELQATDVIVRGIVV